MSKTLHDYSKDELIAKIKDLQSSRRFGLVWEDKTEDVLKESTLNTPVLKEVLDRSLISNSNSNHLIIEGDNYHSIHALNYTHAEKVDVIYIDPPYNTGNQDFIYQDDYVDSDDSYRHSKWLSFMRRRLQQAKNLLNENGTIFISIDENEYAHLKLLCDRIFKPENFVNSFSWINNLKGRQISGSGAAGTHEYILCYAKKSENIAQFTGSAQKLKNIMPSTYKGFNYTIQEDKHGPYVIKNELYNSNSIFNELSRPNLVFDIYFNPTDNTVICDDVSDNHSYEGFVKISPKRNNSGRAKYHAWRWSRNKIINESFNLSFIEQKEGWKVYTKVRSTDETIVKDIITDISTSNGAQDLQKIFSKGTFDFPKPVNLINFILSLNSNKNALILDFFAGSGTTGQAVLELNKEDGGNRQFILCTNNENNIAENITYQRIKKVTEGYGKTEGIPANVRYFKVDLIPKQASIDATRSNLAKHCDDLVRIREDAYEKVAATDDYSFYQSDEKFVAIILNSLDIKNIWQQVEQHNPENKPVKVYAFSYSHYSFSEDIPETHLDYETFAIPEGILEVYKKLARLEKSESSAND